MGMRREIPLPSVTARSFNLSAYARLSLRHVGLACSEPWPQPHAVPNGRAVMGDTSARGCGKYSMPHEIIAGTLSMLVTTAQVGKLGEGGGPGRR